MQRVTTGPVPLAIGALMALSGCGLIDSSVLDFNFVTDDQEFTIDTAAWFNSADVVFPSVPCDPANDLCAATGEEFCRSGTPADCDAVCQPTSDDNSSRCELAVDVAVSNAIDLSNESEFSVVDNQPLAEVTIDNVEYRVVENTLDITSPQLDLYVGPLGAMTPDSADTQPIGLVAPISAGQQTGWTPVDLTAQGQATLRSFMADEAYKSPFTVIVGTRIDLVPGQQPPTGKAVIQVRIRATARPAL
ncbi:MAG: hypothetical protein AAGC55_04280 [Myxococcota bacterium]